MRTLLVFIASFFCQVSLADSVNPAEVALRTRWQNKFISFHTVGLATFCVQGDQAAFDTVAKAIAYGRDYSTTPHNSRRGEFCAQMKIKAPKEEIVKYYREHLKAESEELLKTGATTLCVKDDDGNSEIEKFQYLVRKAGNLISSIDSDPRSLISVRVPHDLQKMPVKEDANRRILCVKVGVGNAMMDDFSPISPRPTH